MPILRRCRGGRQVPPPDWMTADCRPRLAVVVTPPPDTPRTAADLRERTDHIMADQLDLTITGEVAA